MPNGQPAADPAGVAPMIRFDPAGQAPILSYNVPDATSYHGRNLIELELPADVFVPALRTKPADPPATKASKPAAAARRAASPPATTIGRKLPPPARVDPTTGKLKVVGGVSLSRRLSTLDADEIDRLQAAGRRLVLRKNMFGRVDYAFVPEPTRAEPRLLIVESYRLSSFPASYGAGKVIKTLTLLPGERTKVSVKTFQKTESEQKDASSILDSFSEESSEDFEDSVQSEVSDKQNQAANFEYSIEAEGEQSWGSGSVKATAGVKGGSNSAREEFSKNVTNALHKHASKASSKRDVQVNSSFEVKEQSGEETSIEREIQNLNVSRTLNFVFRQMNQAFVSLLHLVDIRIGFFNGFTETREEVALPDLDALLGRVIVDEPRRKIVKAAIVDQLQQIMDYRGQPHALIETVEPRDAAGKPVAGASYLRVKRDYSSTHTDPITGASQIVPGVIMGADTNTLRTDGVIVEALLGQGESLDGYSKDLQQETIRAKTLENELTEARLRREREVARILETKDEAGAAVYARMCPLSPATETSGKP